MFGCGSDFIGFKSSAGVDDPRRPVRSDSFYTAAPRKLKRPRPPKNGKASRAGLFLAREAFELFAAAGLAQLAASDANFASDVEGAVADFAAGALEEEEEA